MTMRRLMIALLASFGAMSCADSTAPAAIVPSDALRDGLFASGVSQVAEPPDPDEPGRASASQIAPVTYISLVPGTVDDGTTATISNARNDASVVAAIVDGGFDPTPLAASPGDTLTVVVTRVAGFRISAELVVPIETEPHIVRTNPPRGQSDVPVNTNVTIVFSEPVLAATVTSASIVLKDGATVIDALVGVQAAAAYAVDVVPLAPLDPLRTYTVVIQPTVTNLNGTPLSFTTSIQFTTSQNAAASLVFASIYADEHVCGLTPDGKAYCWGLNDRGQVGNGTTSNQLFPVPVAGNLTFSSLAIWARRTCGVTTNGAAYCWGGSDYLPSGERLPDRLVPTRVAPNLAFSRLSIGSVTCGVTLTGDAYCWSGPARFGTLGDPAASCPGDWCADPVKVVGKHTFASLDVASYTACGQTTAGAVYCWGGNMVGELGTASTDPDTCTSYRTGADSVAPCSRTPVQVSTGVALTEIRSGVPFVCGLDPDRYAYCWGANNQGQFGNGESTGFTAYPTPTAIAPGFQFRALDVAYQRACGIDMANVAYCWGYNWGGEGGRPGGSNGGTYRLLTPTPLETSLEFAEISVARTLSCALTLDGQAYCWGRNNFGGFGNGSTINSWIPVAVKRQ
jgi:alpha-tubulin suppressor-like RCC1 family protein